MPNSMAGFFTGNINVTKAGGAFGIVSWWFCLIYSFTFEVVEQNWPDPPVDRRHCRLHLPGRSTHKGHISLYPSCWRPLGFQVKHDFLSQSFLQAIHLWEERSDPRVIVERGHRRQIVPFFLQACCRDEGKQGWGVVNLCILNSLIIVSKVGLEWGYSQSVVGGHICSSCSCVGNQILLCVCNLSQRTITSRPHDAWLKARMSDTWYSRLRVNLNATLPRSHKPTVKRYETDFEGGCHQVRKIVTSVGCHRPDTPPQDQLHRPRIWRIGLRVEASISCGSGFVLWVPLSSFWPRVAAKPIPLSS